MPKRNRLGNALKRLAALASAACIPVALAAGAPVLVRDINPQSDTSGSVQAPGMVTVGDTAYFIACNRTLGCELWKSDGTSAGTVLVKDVLAGRNASSGSGKEARDLTNVGGTLYFTISTEAGGRELWKSDGTEAGTVLLKDIASGPGSSNPSQLVAVNGKLYFTAADFFDDVVLWTSDGTEAGTQVVPLPGVPQFDVATIKQLTPGQTILYFVLTRFFGNPEMWRTDGTAAGTFLLASMGSYLAPWFSRKVLGDTIVFGASQPEPDWLWRSDGTYIGTYPIKKVQFACGSFQPEAVVLSGVFYFRAFDAANGCELWRSDGTEAGTYMVRDLVPGTDSGAPSNLTVAQGALYFSNSLQEGFSTRNKLWKSDGTSGGTVLVKDLGNTGSMGELATVSNALVFANNGSLWTSDGTTAGTAVIKNLGGTLQPTALAAGTTRLYFTTSFGSVDGPEPWTSDLTIAGTFRLKEISDGTLGSFPLDLRDAHGTLYFHARPPSGFQGLWSSDGTAAGTNAVANSPTFSERDLVGVMGSASYFARDGKLYRVEGGSAVELATDIVAITPVFQAKSYAVANGFLYFPAHGYDFGDSTDIELWKTDGTAAGTSRVKDINPGAGGSYPDHFVAAGGTVYFTTTFAFPPGLWKTDGTEAGTVLVKSDVYTVGRRGDKVVFGGAAGSSGLWVSDGTPAGTQQISTVDSAGQFVEADGVTYFVRAPGFGDVQLWKTDGTSAGTSLVKTFDTSMVPPIVGIVAVQSGVFFFLQQFSGGHALWHSDGTEAGTVVLRTFTGPPTGGARVGTTFYFSIPDGVYGTEIWKSDGTVAGTVLAAQVVPGSGDGAVANLTVSGNKLYFVAQNEATGPELFMIAFDGTPDAFTFTGMSDVATGATMTSNAVTANGLEIQVPISVAGGQYSIGCTGTFTSFPGIIEPGQSVCVRHVASALTDATTTTTLRVGDYGTSFTSRTVENVLTNPRLFSAQQYRDFLGREGDPDGLAFYEQLLASGAVTQAQVIEAFLASPEFQNGLPQMTRLYFAFFNRIPDYAGLMFQVAAYRSGAPLEGIAENFSLSPEFTDRYGALTDEQYVDLVYQNVLGRAPDPGGRQYYLERLGDGRLTRGRMMIGFSESPEFQQIVENEVYVIAVYVGMLRRTPEMAGLYFYVNLIESGLPRNAIIGGFLGSPEYRGRFLP